jgi:hypothetical protein
VTFLARTANGWFASLGKSGIAESGCNKSGQEQRYFIFGSHPFLLKKLILLYKRILHTWQLLTEQKMCQLIRKDYLYRVNKLKLAGWSCRVQIKIVLTPFYAWGKIEDLQRDY